MDSLDRSHVGVRTGGSADLPLPHAALRFVGGGLVRPECVIANAAGTGDISFTLRLGYRRPARDATSGRVILAFQDCKMRQRSLKTGQLSDGEADAGFRAMLDEITARGFLVAESHDMPGVTDISAPILDRQGRAAASIVIPYLNRRSARTRHEEVLAELLATCREISAELG